MATIITAHINSLSPNSVAVQVRIWTMGTIAPATEPSVIPIDIGRASTTR